MSSSLQVFLFTILLFFAGSITQPFFIFYVLDVVGISAFEFGLLMAIVASISSIFLIIGGKISDKKGRKYVILMTVFLLVLSTLVLLFSKSFFHLVLFAILNGVESMGFSSLIPYVADHVKPKVRAKVLGLASFVMMLGSTPAPLIGGWLYSFFPAFPFLVLIGVGILTFFVGMKALS